jgi:hypothetical protein
MLRLEKPSYEDLAFAVRLIGTNTPAALIRKDAVVELHKRGVLAERPDRVLIISEIGKLICARVKAGERVAELE